MKKITLTAMMLALGLSLSAQNPRTKLATLPPMGWMTWNQFEERISEDLIKEIADLMVSEGYRDAGYEYIYIDDCWQGGRDKRNNIIPDPEKFPSGIKALADYVHAKGLKLGIYSDAAPLTCAGYTASLGFEEQDARTFASWDIDYLKYDYCGAPDDSAVAHVRYRRMADALDKCGRTIVLGICEWGVHHAEHWAADAGGSLYRTSGDVRDKWKDLGGGGLGIIDIINMTAPLHPFATPGCWFDMDMLIAGLYGKGGPSSDLGGVGCSDTEYQSQMSIWAMMASPLAMSHDLRNANQKTKDILLNKEIIAIDQDPLGQPAERVVNDDKWMIFVRPLSGGRHAIAALNLTDCEQSATLDFAKLGIDGKHNLRDPWLHSVVGKNTNKWKGKIQPHETKVLVLD